MIKISSNLNRQNMNVFLSKLGENLIYFSKSEIPSKKSCLERNLKMYLSRDINVKYGS